MMTDIFEQIEKGIIVEVQDVKQAMSVDKIANAAFVSTFDLDVIDEILDAISIPVIASCRIGHIVEARILEKMGVAMIDESNPNKMPYIAKLDFSCPFVCRIETADEAIARAKEGARAVRTEFSTVDDVIGSVTALGSGAKKLKLIGSLSFATPQDIAFLFQLGCSSVIISTELFRSPNPPKLMDAFMKAARYYNDVEKIFQCARSVSKILPTSTSAK